jgi:hypothetical protein
MKHIKPYQIFEASAAAPQTLTQDQIDWLDECTVRRSWEYNPSTGLVDVNGDFDCREQGLKDFKGIRFGDVRGHFQCGENELKSLEGAPSTVKGIFACDDNQLTSLEGAPQIVKGDFFSCNYNQLTSLEGAPQIVKGDFYCNENQLTSLEGAPQIVGRSFYCDDNQLTNLKGAPREIGTNFSCENNKITSLDGAPQIVKGKFSCGENPMPESILLGIFELMKNGKSYQQVPMSYHEALEEYWIDMDNEDRVFVYKQMLPQLNPEEIRKYKALEMFKNIKNQF